MRHDSKDSQTMPDPFNSAMQSYIDSDEYEQETQAYNKLYFSFRNKLTSEERAEFDQLMIESYKSNMKLARKAYQEGLARTSSKEAVINDDREMSC